MKRQLSDIGCAGILIVMAFIFAIPFFFGLRPIPLEESRSTQSKYIKTKKRRKKAKAKAKKAGIKAAKNQWKKASKQELSKLKSLQWKTVFFDDFSRNTLGDNWAFPFGEWKIKAGRLTTLNNKKESVIYFKNFNFNRNFRLTYQGRDLKKQKGKVCDLSFLYLAKPNKKVDNSRGFGSFAYIFRFGSYYNTMSGICRGSTYLQVDKKHLITSGKNSQVVITVYNKLMVMSIDGIRIFAGYDLHPPKKTGDFGWGAFYIFRRLTSFDNVKIEVPKN